MKSFPYSVRQGLAILLPRNSTNILMLCYLRYFQAAWTEMVRNPHQQDAQTNIKLGAKALHWHQTYSELGGKSRYDKLGVFVDQYGALVSSYKYILRYRCLYQYMVVGGISNVGFPGVVDIGKDEMAPYRG